MLEGLFAAIALFFAPSAGTVREPAPLLAFDMRPAAVDPGIIICKSPPLLWVEVIGHDRILIRYSGEDRGYGSRSLSPAELPEFLKKAGGDELGDRVFVSASDDVPYRDVIAQVGFLRSLGVRKIGLVGGQVPTS